MAEPLDLVAHDVIPPEVPGHVDNPEKMTRQRALSKGVVARA